MGFGGPDFRFARAVGGVVAQGRRFQRVICFHDESIPCRDMRAGNRLQLSGPGAGAYGPRIGPDRLLSVGPDAPLPLLRTSSGREGAPGVQKSEAPSLPGLAKPRCA